MVRSSIAARLFVLFFGFSVGWFTFTTAFQTLLEYRETRVALDSTLEDLSLATRAGLENALWSYDLGLVVNGLSQMRSVHLLSGAEVRDETGRVIGTWGVIPPEVGSGEAHNAEALFEPLYHRFPLSHIDSHGLPHSLGDLTLVVDLPVLGAQVGDRIRLIVSNYLANTLGLMVILLVGLRAFVSRPLGEVSRAIEDYRFDRSDVQPPRYRRPDELWALWKSFESLTLVLKESWVQQRVMSAILEEAAVMALVCDNEGRVVSSNAQARARLGDGQPGGHLSRLAYGGAPLFEDPLGLLAQGRPWRGELNVRGENDRQLWLSAALLPLTVADEPRARWGVMIEDVSAAKLTAQYLHERDLAREAARNKSLFLANLSHEIRTPMNAVVGLTALALQEEVSPRVREFLSQLSLSGAALLGVINDILDYSKLEEGKVTLESVDFALAEVLRSVEVLARFQAEEKGLVFRLSSRGTPEMLRGDPLRVQQVLSNLVSNAVKFTEVGEVSVTVMPTTPPGPTTRGWVRFEVRDTGIGIGAHDQERVFQSFTQADSSTTRLYGGTGLGLAITRQLVDLIGGHLGLESQLGQGSLFWFEAPLVPEAALPAGSASGLAGLRVLLADDNKVNQLVARELLAKVGIHPVIVANGREAVDRCLAEPFDLVLMDLQMPVMDGLEAVRLLRQTFTPDQLPVLAMTAHTSSKERQICQDAGMQDLVPKPVEPAVLYGLIRRWRRVGTTT